MEKVHNDSFDFARLLDSPARTCSATNEIIIDKYTLIIFFLWNLLTQIYDNYAFQMWAYRGMLRQSWTKKSRLLTSTFSQNLMFRYATAKSVILSEYSRMTTWKNAMDR